MRKKKQFKADKSSISEIVAFIEQSLNDFGVKKKAYTIMNYRLNTGKIRRIWDL